MSRSDRRGRAIAASGAWRPLAVVAAVPGGRRALAVVPGAWRPLAVVTAVPGATRALVVVVAVLVAAGAVAGVGRADRAAGAARLRAASEPLRPAAEALTFPVASLDGAVETTGARVTLRADVLFAFGRARLGSGAAPRVRAAAGVIRSRPGSAVRVTGYTDAIGTPAANLVLSRRRAAAVARALRAALGPAAPAITAVGRGEADPVAVNSVDGRDDPRGRALNRRVELAFAG